MVLLCLLDGAVGWGVSGGEQPPPQGDAPVSFREKIAPVFVRKCLQCHGPDKAKGGYRLHQFSFALKSGDSERPALVPGRPDQSELFQRLIATNDDDRMPQKDDPLPQSEIALIERWIREGARFDGADPNGPIESLIPRQSYPEPPLVYQRPVPILALAFRLDGLELAASGYHEVTIWNASNGTLLRRIPDVPQRIQALAYSPDGRWLAAAGGAPGKAGELLLINAMDGSVGRVLSTAGDMFLAVSFSPDGSRIAVGGTDNSIRIYDALSGEEELVIQQHADWVMALAYDTDGLHLASASRDRTARIYNTKTGELETTYTDHNAPVFAIAFSHDGKLVYSAGRDRKVHVWNRTDAKKTGEIAGFGGDILRIVVEADSVFSCAADRQVRQHSVADRKLVRTFSDHKDWVNAIAFHRPTKRLASGSHDGAVHVWDLENGKTTGSFTAAPGLVQIQGH